LFKTPKPQGVSDLEREREEREREGQAVGRVSRLGLGEKEGRDRDTER
jgi:hypothetical protein